MLIQKTFSIIFITALLFSNLFAQKATQTNIKQPEISPELRKSAVEFLRQTIKEIPNLKAEENRQYFTIETARLLWKYDEKEARRMIEQVIEDFKKSHSAIIAKAKKANVSISDMYPSVKIAKQSKPPNLEHLQILSEFSKISKTKENLIFVLISIEPEMAYQFITEYPEIESIQGDQGYYSSIKPRIVDALLARNDLDKSLLIARELLEREFSSTYIDILRRIYKKDSSKGRELAEETLQKITSSADYKVTTFLLNLFFDTCEENKDINSKDSMLSVKSLINLAKLLGEYALTKYDVNNPWVLEDIAYKIKKYSPQQSLQIRQALKKKSQPIVNANATNTATREYWGWANDSRYPSNAPANRVVSVAIANANKAVSVSVSKRGYSKKTKSNMDEPRPKSDWEIRQERRVFLSEKLRNGSFTANEKRQLIEEIKGIVFSESVYQFTRPDGFLPVVEKLSGFAMICRDKELGKELLREAEVYIRPETKSYADYVSKLLLAMGYSSIDPKKSFQIIESLVSINGVIENAINLGEFANGEENLIVSGEANASFFLGEIGFTRNVFRQAESIPQFLRNLSESDFSRTKEIAKKFEKREIRMAANLLLLQSLFGENPATYRPRGIDFD